MKLTSPLSEDAAFRYPAWLLAALLVSAYMLTFTFGRVLNWSHTVQVCLGDPAECLNTNVSRYVLFSRRLLGREGQAQMKHKLESMIKVQKTYQKQIEAVAEAYAVVEESDSGNLVAALIEMDDTINELFLLVNATSDALNSTTKTSEDLAHWRAPLEKRYFACAVVGFVLGLLLGLSTLLRTAASFRSAARELRLARFAKRFQQQQQKQDQKQQKQTGSSSGDDDRRAATYNDENGNGDDDQSSTNCDSEHDAGRHRGRGVAPNPLALWPTTTENSIVQRSEATKITLAVFFFGVLLSTAIVQLYAVGVTLSVVLALLVHPWTWNWLLRNYYMWLVAIIVGIAINKVFLITFIGNTWLSDGDRIHRPAAWLAFMVVASATNLVIGLFIALYRIILLLLTTIFTLGKLDETLFSMMAFLDLPHQTFLAGLHLQESMSNFHDGAFLPGPRGRAHRRWQMLRDTVASNTPARLQELVQQAGRREDGSGAEDHGLAIIIAAPSMEYAETPSLRHPGSRQSSNAAAAASRMASARSDRSVP